MTFEELIALQPQWVQIWLNVLLVGAFILPLVLLIWKQSRIAAVITVIASGLAGFGVIQMFERMGYVKLLGLPHIILWTPLAWYLYRQIGREDMPQWPRRIMIVVMATILISLAFDYVDVARWLLGERTPFTG
jgi:hypothetical protein